MRINASIIYLQEINIYRNLHDTQVLRKDMSQTLEHYATMHLYIQRISTHSLSFES